MAPKKKRSGPPRNAFYFYMMEKKEEMMAQGKHHGDMAKVAEMCSPMWTSMADDQKEK